MELTYGMKFVDEDGDVYMLCQVGSNSNLLIAITGFDVGNRWNEKNIETTNDLPYGFKKI